ncbi:hypothetical protein CRG98_025037 [Punica granatum]|uniref:Uncharacterized protein n=1 Tax=Punica granatum TaxID=22663 RepID=A0A2I0JEU0_PUNGR|nr:hypothetical protein CRG98_025037 [Punica granatum]
MATSHNQPSEIVYESMAKVSRRHRESSMDIMLSFEEQMTKVENIIAEVQGKAADAFESVKGLTFDVEELRGDMQGALNAVVDELNRCDDALETLLTAMRIEQDELKVELERVKRTRVVGASVVILDFHLDIPKPSVFKGSRVAKDVDNFLWSMETYFRAVRVEDDEVYVGTISMYLVDTMLLWWRGRSGVLDLNKAMFTAKSLIEFRSENSDSKKKGKANVGGDKPHKLDGGKTQKLAPKDEMELNKSWKKDKEKGPLKKADQRTRSYERVQPLHIRGGHEEAGALLEQTKGQLKAVNSKEVPTCGIAWDVPIHRAGEALNGKRAKDVFGHTTFTRDPEGRGDLSCSLEEKDAMGNGKNIHVEVARVLTEFKDVMPQELPKKLSPKREVDHRIELVPDIRPLTMEPYRMAPP